MEFCGSLVAIVSPFDVKGRIDIQSLEKLVEWQIEQGTEGIVCCGATGEATSLRPAERWKILEVCLKVAAGRVPVLLGTGTPDTRETVRFTEKAQKIGAQGCLVVTPFYNRPSQRGSVLHYKEVAKVGIPIVAYHNPPRTQLRLQVETVAEIGLIKGIAALKDSSGDLDFIRKVRNATPLPILSGEDWLTFEILREGGVGTISTVANVIPGVWKKMIRFAREGNLEKAKLISDHFQPLCRALFLESNPQCVKFVLSLMGKCRQDLRLPLVPPLEQIQAELKEILLGLRLPRFLSEETKVPSLPSSKDTVQCRA
ncbi:MAG: 4-hydroxy-tetrahydrodipicolinate synthase [Verrucomicrobia bacterium]|nr:4-hydroxy-tetrahydrodipicolinate synthase [Verrucomicrobiota bacterium]